MERLESARIGHMNCIWDEMRNFFKMHMVFLHKVCQAGSCLIICMTSKFTILPLQIHRHKPL